jgi:hypothetical protein
MQIKQSFQRAWQNFWWHPITGPMLPMAALIGGGMWMLHAVGLTNEAGNPASFNDVDCRNFATRAEAQAFFEANRPGDPYWLDLDSDGRVCEVWLGR